MLHKAHKIFGPMLAASSLTACGLITPDIKSPLQPLDTDALVANIVGHVKSEVGCAVITLINSDLGYSQANKQPRNLPWLDDGVVKLTLNLTVEEKGSLGPSATYTKVLRNSVTPFATGGNVTNGQSFSLGFGANLSSDATRKISSDYTFSVRNDFLAHKSQYTLNKYNDVCKPYQGALIGGDLKISDSFAAALTPQLINNPGKGTFVVSSAPDVLQTEISFVVAGSGSISPTWKLIPTSINPSSTLAAVSRTSTNDVLITIGPKGATTQTAHNIGKAGALLDQAVESGM